MQSFQLAACEKKICHHPPVTFWHPVAQVLHSQRLRVKLIRVLHYGTVVFCPVKVLYRIASWTSFQHTFVLPNLFWSTAIAICGCHLECCFMLSLPLHNFIFSAVSNQHMHLSLAFKHVTCFYLLSIVAVVRGILMCGWRQVFLKLNTLCHHVQCYSVSRVDLLVKAASGRAGTCVWWWFSKVLVTLWICTYLP